MASTACSLVYENQGLTGVPEASWAPRAETLPSHRPRRLSGLSPEMLRASRSCIHTRLTSGLATRTSTSALPPPTVGTDLRCQALVRSPVAIWA